MRDAMSGADPRPLAVSEEMCPKHTDRQTEQTDKQTDKQQT